MKKKILFGLFGAIALTGCSGEDSADVSNEQDSLMSLSRIVTFTPLEENYETRQVAYYDNGVFIADTLFDNTGGIINRSARTTTGNNTTVTTYNTAGEAISVIINTYDGINRLTEVRHELGEDTYTKFMAYNIDGSVTVSYRHPGMAQTIPYITYYGNTGGLLTSSAYIDEEESAHLVFSNGLPSQLLLDPAGSEEFVAASFTYYDVPVPANQLKSTTSLNNAVLQQDQLNRIADYSSKHLKGYDGLFDYEKEFNSLNYVVYQKSSLLGEQPLTTELFYYYDE